MLSIIIPIHNELDNIEKLSNNIKIALKIYKYEVIFINDGSNDGSADLLNSIIKKFKYFQVIHLKKNFGQTAAIQAGFDKCKGEIIIPMDGDLQNDPNDIPNLISKLEQGYDVVSGWRKNRKDAKISRILPSKIANYIISKISGVHLHDYGCTLKAYRKDIVKDIKLYGEMHRFVPIYASWEGAKVAEEVVTHHARIAGKTKYGLSRIPIVILDLLVIRFFEKSLDRPIHLFGKFGLISFLFAFILSVYAIWLKFFENISFILTPLPLTIVFFAMSGLLCIFLGLVAEIQSRTYFEARGKPQYVIKNIKKNKS